MAYVAIQAWDELNHAHVHLMIEEISILTTELINMKKLHFSPSNYSVNIILRI